MLASHLLRIVDARRKPYYNHERAKPREAGRHFRKDCTETRARFHPGLDKMAARGMTGRKRDEIMMELQATKPRTTRQTCVASSSGRRHRVVWAGKGHEAGPNRSRGRERPRRAL